MICIERMATAISLDNQVLFDVPVEVPNGVIVLFTTTDPYVAGTLEVFRDQLTMEKTTDFAETDADAGTFTMVSAPLTGEKIWCKYVKQ